MLILAIEGQFPLRFDEQLQRRIVGGNVFCLDVQARFFFWFIQTCTSARPM